ncbi:STAS domain-containing protein [Streptomyces sp. AK02-01A]|uniref:STAS domain-containing protein n=1 Tax=Streptomyces sp. AK02-01A TaxID=3028648 RepID=UPI0029AC742B|nr:STAS domain-containing protein [Streptomyces sp. AK02-01A]MDX3852315.1 STAS domain-containing protein [Streptomyces sp. AK02-01A]
MSSGRGTGLLAVDATDPIVLVIAGRLTPADVPRLCAELTTRLRDSAGAEVICDVGGLIRPDLTAVEALARLQLTARGRIRLRGADRELRLLLGVVGLGEVLG